jgi:plasmid stabilization system protein ParE
VSRLIWTPAALADVQRLFRFLAANNLHAARRDVNAIRAGVKTLEGQPRAGRAVEEMDPEFREWLIPFGASGYVVLYRFEDPLVAILAVSHQREAGYGPP